MIKTTLIGNLGNDCIVNTVNSKSVINFNVAHTEKYKDATGVERSNTIWCACSYWVDKIGIAQYLRKGQLVYVEGQPNVKQYTDNNGQTKSQLTLRVQSIQLLGSTQNRNESAPVHSQQQESYNVPSDDDSGLPF